MDKPIIIVDFSMMAHRCYHAMDFLQTSTGVKTGMEYGTLKALEKLDNPIVCFDNYSKTDMPDGYKANRQMQEPDFYKRLHELKEAVRALYLHVEEPRTEADRLMYAISQDVSLAIIMTNDKDLFQAIRPGVEVHKQYKNETFVWDEERVWDKYKVHPQQWAVFRSFTGDPSDNLKGVKYFGDEIIAEYVREGKTIFGTSAIFDREFETFSKRQQQSWREFNLNTALSNFNLILLTHMPYTIRNPTKVDISSYLDRLEIKSLSTQETEF